MNGLDHLYEISDWILHTQCTIDTPWLVPLVLFIYLLLLLSPSVPTVEFLHAWMLIIMLLVHWWGHCIVFKNKNKLA